MAVAVADEAVVLDVVVGAATISVGEVRTDRSLRPSRSHLFSTRANLILSTGHSQSVQSFDVDRYDQGGLSHTFLYSDHLHEPTAISCPESFPDFILHTD
jgi:hypothetical protein